jgi:hypothetical protein
MHTGFNSTLQASQQMIADNFHSKFRKTGLISFEQKEQEKLTKRVEVSRPRPRMQFCQADSSDEESDQAFQASPAEDIPRNKLTEKLVRGLQNYI